MSKISKTLALFWLPWHQNFASPPSLDDETIWPSDQLCHDSVDDKDENGKGVYDKEEIIGNEEDQGKASRGETTTLELGQTCRQVMCKLWISQTFFTPLGGKCQYLKRKNNQLFELNLVVSFPRTDNGNNLVPNFDSI